MKKALNIMKNIVLWILSVFFIIGAAAFYSSSIASSILLLLTGASCNPFLLSKLKPYYKKAFIPAIVCVILFFSSMLCVPTTESGTNNVQTAENETELKQETAISSAENADIETKSEEDSYEPSSKNTDQLFNEEMNNKIETVATDTKANDKKTTAPRKEESEDNEDINIPPSELKMHFIDVEQGDSTLIECDHEYMLIDGGNNWKGTTVQLYLSKQNVDKLKYVVGTHPDADHIGGLDVIITKYPVDTVFMPNITADTQTYYELMDAMKYKSLNPTVPVINSEYKLGSASVKFLSPTKNYSDDNNNSLVVRITHGDNSFLLTGDAEIEVENDLISSGCDIPSIVLKAGHHGSSTASSPSFINSVAPEYVVISCGKDNSYGHPHQETLDLLKSKSINVFRTDEQGNIVCTSDGKTLSWSAEPSTTWKAGSNRYDANSSQNSDNASFSEQNNTTATLDNNSEEVTQTAPGTSYVINTNTGKFHIPSCKSVKQMKEKNRKDVTATRDEVISMGYDPCKNCNP